MIAPDDPRVENQRLTPELLLPYLVADGLLTEAQGKELQQLSRLREAARADHPLVWLAGRGLKSATPPYVDLDLDRLVRWLAESTGLPYLRIDPLSIDVDAVTRDISKPYVMRYGILPVAVTADKVVFAVTEPFRREWEREMAHFLRKEIGRVIANPLDILRYQEEFFSLTQSMRKAWRERRLEAAAGITNLEALVELGRTGKLDANDRHVVSIVDWLLQYAFDQRASDIHIEPRRDTGNIRFRIDGALHTVYEMPSPVMAAVTSRIKALGRMDIIEKRRPQDGRVKTRTPTGQEVELRISTMPTAFGEKMVLRIFDPEVVASTLEELGFTTQNAERWNTMTHRSHGIVLVTGPTGSGKTTTLYSTLKGLADPTVNVCTVEDPIEMVEPSFNQMQTNAAIGVDFAAGIRTLMRQDPDIIMVGEIRDLATAEMAIQASLTGHLVFSTLHTNDAPTTITRLMDLGVPYYLIGATLSGVVAQRLVRTLCPHCKRKAPLDAQEWQGLTHPWNTKPPEYGYEPVGCLECRQTGFLGRIGIYEMLLMSGEVRALLGPDMSLEQLRKLCIRQGMEPLRISGARKVAAGLTTVEEVLRVTPSSADG